MSDFKVRLLSQTSGNSVFDDHHAFREIVANHQQRIFRVALAMTGSRTEAEDITQDAFLRAYRARSSFREEASIGTWLYRIAVNLSLDVLSHRQGKSRTVNSTSQREEQRHEPSAGSGDDPERIAESSMIGKDIEAALSSLTPRERAVFILRHYEDMALKDVASTLSIRLGTVKSLLFRAVVKLQKELWYYQKEMKN